MRMMHIRGYCGDGDLVSAWSAPGSRFVSYNFGVVSRNGVQWGHVETWRKEPGLSLVEQMLRDWNVTGPLVEIG